MSGWKAKLRALEQEFRDWDRKARELGEAEERIKRINFRRVFEHFYNQAWGYGNTAEYIYLRKFQNAIEDFADWLIKLVQYIQKEYKQRQEDIYYWVFAWWIENDIYTYLEEEWDTDIEYFDYLLEDIRPKEDY